MKTPRVNLAGIVSIIIAIAGIIACLLFPQMSRRQFIPPTEYGTPLIYVEEPPEKQSGVGQILEYENCLYLLDDTAGTISVYDRKGSYLKTIAFHVSSINGAFKMAGNGNRLYVIDRSSNVYVFENGNFTEFVTRKNASDIRRQYDFETTSNDYIARFGAVWHKKENRTACLIQNAYTFVNYGDFILLLSMVPVVVSRLLKKRHNIPHPLKNDV